MLTTDVSLFWHISCKLNDFNDLNSDKRIEISLLDEEIVVQLVNSHSHSKENAEAMKKEVLHLLNYVPFSYSVKDKFGNSQCCTV